MKDTKAGELKLQVINFKQRGYMSHLRKPCLKHRGKNQPHALIPHNHLQSFHYILGREHLMVPSQEFGSPKISMHNIFRVNDLHTKRCHHLEICLLSSSRSNKTKAEQAESKCKQRGLTRHQTKTKPITEDA